MPRTGLTCRVRWVERIAGGESLSMVSTMVCVHTILRENSPLLKMGLLGAYDAPGNPKGQTRSQTCCRIVGTAPPPLASRPHVTRATRQVCVRHPLSPKAQLGTDFLHSRNPVGQISATPETTFPQAAKIVW